jgi:TonB family protein
MADLSQPNNFNTPDDHLSRLLVSQVEDPWYRSLYRSLKETFNPPKLPPLELTSKPVAVKDIWGLYGRQKKSFMMSTGFQVAVVVILFTVFSSKPVQKAVQATMTLIMPTDLNEYTPKAAPKKQAMGGGGGGGDRSPLPASKGRLPKASLRQFTPPMAVINNPNPRLTMEPSIIAPPDVNLPNVNMAQYGDPLAKIGPPSNGPGSGGGIGSGSGGGVGSGKGGGFGPGEGGGVGGGVYRVGGGVTAPVVLSKKDPEYSEEARKAKYQGTVLLSIEVSPSGLASNIKVVRSLGLGLDEKAIEAVKQWKFKPGYKDGKPVTVAATIEVNFRLL